MPEPDPTPTPTPTPAPQPTPSPAPTPEPPADPPLGEAGQRALEREREARKNEERARKAAEKERDDLKRAQESDQERLKREADEGKALSVTATDKLRKANLLTALSEKGLSGASAKAAARLIDGVEYDDEDEPTNLDARIDAAKADYGEGFFSGATPPTTPPPGTTPPATPPTHPNLHQGPRQPADPTEDDQFAAYMKTHFPQPAADPAAAAA